MSEQVRVESVDALKRFRVALCKFAETVKVGLDEAEAEIQRASLWLNQDQHRHWKRQTEKRTELYTRAKSDLNRKKAQKTALGARLSYVDEEKALAAAERQLEEAKQKLANVRRWTRLLDEESFSYKAAAQGMNLAVEADVPNGLARLDNMIAALEAYASSAPPSEQRSTVPTPIGEEIGLQEGPASMARAAPATPGSAAEVYQRLRAQTPSQVVRDATPIGATEFDWRKADVADRSVQDVLGELDLARTPSAADDKIVVARRSWKHERIYLERVERMAAGDSGWYVGVVDDTEVDGYDAVRVADLLAGRPDLAAVVELPAGCLVVLDGARLEAVLDAQGTLLWPPAAARQ
jgi:hypothetical protein